MMDTTCRNCPIYHWLHILYSDDKLFAAELKIQEYSKKNFVLSSKDMTFSGIAASTLWSILEHPRKHHLIEAKGTLRCQKETSKAYRKLKYRSGNNLTVYTDAS